MILIDTISSFPLEDVALILLSHWEDVVLIPFSHWEDVIFIIVSLEVGVVSSFSLIVFQFGFQLVETYFIIKNKNWGENLVHFEGIFELYGSMKFHKGINNSWLRRG